MISWGIKPKQYSQKNYLMEGFGGTILTKTNRSNYEAT